MHCDNNHHYAVMQICITVMWSKNIQLFKLKMIFITIISVDLLVLSFF